VTEFVFVTGMGRSGTALLAELLARAQAARVQHEAIGDHSFAVSSWYLASGAFAEPYLRRARARLGRVEADVLVDVNSYLRHATPALRTVFNPREIFHLVRDPRDVVRSIYLRRDPATVQPVPSDIDDLERWLDGDKLFQVCWNWSATTDRLLDEGLPVLRLEDIIRSYSTTAAAFEPVGLRVSESDWKRVVSHRTNASRPKPVRLLRSRLRGTTDAELPPFSEWPAHRRDLLLEVCGPTMKRLGYSAPHERAPAGNRPGP
jgi:hypothetical protein